VDEAHLASPAGGACRPGCVRLPALLAAIAPDAPRCALSAV
jgi:superfamily II DNA helicase RecQ